MSEAVWLAGERVELMIPLLPHGLVPERKYRLFAVECVRVIRSHLTDPRSLRALEFAEAHADQQPFFFGAGRNFQRRYHRVERAAQEVCRAMDAELAGAAVDNNCHPDEWGRISIRASATKAAWGLLALIAPSVAQICVAFAGEVISVAANEPYQPGKPPESYSGRRALAEHQRTSVSWLRDIFGNPFRPVAFDPAWRTSAAVALASRMYESRDFAPMPILADALQDAGCENADILDHCRGGWVHVRGCWVVDLVLGKA